ncbi:SLC13 family permease [Natronomonas salina]|uniref:SLC13 family permease n=1 Tax=Natronomonas salina TaxID=1710540 RepID=UPI0015B66C75|nr:SLC13 family permease [Natronomonas salina]QLD91276.1 SLC13 family permease [Natronomonas salina]
MLVVFAIILVALLFFVTEPVPIDITAIGVMVALIVLEPMTGVSPEAGVSGFANPATITVLAMFVLSEGIRRTGVVNIIGRRIADRFGDSPTGQLVAVLGLSGGTAGFINNTPVVAVMIPMVTELSKRTGISPSRLLIPVSYVSMLGGMLTLIGTSSNILASDVYDRVGGEATEPFAMFEFTALGALLLVVGTAYLLVAAPRLLPERVKARMELTDEFEMTQYLTEVVVSADSPMIGRSVEGALSDIDVDADIVQLIRNGQAFNEPLARKEVRADDILVLRVDRESLVGLMDAEGLTFAPDAEVTDELLEADEEAVEELEETDDDQRLVEIVLTPDTNLLGETLETLNFRQRYDASVLAIRRGGDIIHQRMDERRLRAGDTLLIQANEETVRRFQTNRNFVVAQELTRPDFRSERIPVAVGIVAAVVAVAALGVLPIMVSALAGIIAMVATGCVRPNEVYDAIDWNVIFLLAGLIPLGVAMENTGAAAWLADVVVANSAGVGVVAMVGIFYLFTSLITNVVSNNASVVLMIPVAYDAGQQLGADPFAFVLAVTFAASTAMLTPIGYQTNLMVYGPGGYRFTDFTRIGAPLQLILTVVTTLGIVWLYGV